jgi:enamine deaminase RidA (YjgF/YER057c/UK114 family)
LGPSNRDATNAMERSTLLPTYGVPPIPLFSSNKAGCAPGKALRRSAYYPWAGAGPKTCPTGNRWDEKMRLSRSLYMGLAGMALAMFGLCRAADAADITRLAGPNPKSPIVDAVAIPMGGYTLYFISGTPAGPADPTAPVGSPQRTGDTATQTDSSLDRLGKTLTQLGLGFGDVVQAHVFMAGDPAKGGDIDFAGMNREWSKKFGTPDQPNKPARSTVKVAGLAGPGALVEIEFVAAKKN